MKDIKAALAENKMDFVKIGKFNSVVNHMIVWFNGFVHYIALGKRKGLRYSFVLQDGGVAERFNATVLKTVEG